MKFKLVLLFIVCIYGLNGCVANDLHATLSNIKVNSGEIIVELKITNLSERKYFIDNMYLSSSEGALTHNVLEVLDERKKTIRYRGMYRDYSEHHDYNKTAVLISPRSSITKQINISSHYLLLDNTRNLRLQT